MAVAGYFRHSYPQFYSEISLYHYGSGSDAIFYIDMWTTHRARHVLSPTIYILVTPPFRYCFGTVSSTPLTWRTRFYFPHKSHKSLQHAFVTCLVLTHPLCTLLCSLLTCCSIPLQLPFYLTITSSLLSELLVRMVPLGKYEYV